MMTLVNQKIIKCINYSNSCKSKFKILVMGLIHVGVLYSFRSGTLHYIGCRLFRGMVVEIGKPSK